MRHDAAYPRLAELVGLSAAGPDHAALNDHAEGCAVCRRRLEELRALDAALTRLEPLPAAPPGLTDRVLAIPRDARTQRPSSAGRRWAVAAATAAVLLMSGLALHATIDFRSQETTFVAQRTISLTPPVYAPIDVVVEMGRPTGTRMPVRVIASGLPYGDGRYYALWLRGDEGAVMGGLFEPDGKGRCVVMLEVPAGIWRSVDITEGDGPPSAGATVASGAI